MSRAWSSPRTACQIATALVGKQRLEKVTMHGRARPQHPGDLAQDGDGILQVLHADADQDGVDARGRRSAATGRALRSWTNQRVSRGLAASSAAFMPWPITAAIGDVRRAGG